MAGVGGKKGDKANEHSKRPLGLREDADHFFSSVLKGWLNSLVTKGSGGLNQPFFGGGIQMLLLSWQLAVSAAPRRDPPSRCVGLPVLHRWRVVASTH